MNTPIQNDPSIHQRRLSALLEIAFGHATNDRRRMLAEQWPDADMHYVDSKAEQTRKLILSEKIESTTLLQTEIYRTILEGAQPMRAMRELLPTIRTTSNKLQINLGETGSYSPEVPEGAEVPSYEEDYSSRDFTIKKYAERPEITSEMIDDSLFDVAALQVAAVGERLENTLNQQALSVLIENATYEHDCTGSNLGIAAIRQARKLLNTAGRMPDAVILHPEAEALVQENLTPIAAYWPVNNAFQTGAVPPILGMKSGMVGVTDVSATYTWDYDSDGDIGMLVMKSKYAGAIVMRQDMTVVDYKDPIHDLMGMVVKMRFGVNYLDPAAACRVEY